MADGWMLGKCRQRSARFQSPREKLAVVNVRYSNAPAFTPDKPAGPKVPFHSVHGAVGFKRVLKLSSTLVRKFRLKSPPPRSMPQLS